MLENARGRYPEAELAEAVRLLVRMQAHVVNASLGVGHQSSDYQCWHGQPALDGDLLRIKDELSRLEQTRQATTAGMNPQPHTSPTGD